MTEGLSTARKIALTASTELVLEPHCEASGGKKQRFALLIFCDDEAQLRVLTEDAAVVLGREAPSEVVVDDPAISRQHTRFVLRQGDVSVEDLDSRNGTFVHGERVTKRRLVSGDEVRIGGTRIVLAATRLVETSLLDEVNGSADRVLENPKMKELYGQAARASQASVPVLILGETGSGKELVASCLHREGSRREKPFVVVNCAAIPASLLESTLFGHERGAFTGATSRAVGMFERANGGVLFLDEIGELTTSAQAALLRAIETGRVCRVGASSEVAVDVRIVAATHCDLEAMVEERTFRQDLYFRLSGLVLSVPPLRERPDEIAPLVQFFLQRARTEWGVRARHVAADATRALERYQWPGNVRQLRHAVERAALLGGGDTILVKDLPEYVFSSGPSRVEAVLPEPSGELGLRQQLQRYERVLIEETLRRAAGNRQIAAKLLRIPMRTLFRRMRACGVGGTQGLVS